MDHVSRTMNALEQFLRRKTALQSQLIESSYFQELLGSGIRAFLD
jgi:hypothetical protein